MKVKCVESGCGALGSGPGEGRHVSFGRIKEPSSGPCKATHTRQCRYRDRDRDMSTTAQDRGIKASGTTGSQKGNALCAA